MNHRAFKDVLTWVYDGSNWQVWIYEDNTLIRIEGSKPGSGDWIPEQIDCSLAEAEDTAWKLRRKYLRDWCCDRGYLRYQNNQENFERIMSSVTRL